MAKFGININSGKPDSGAACTKRVDVACDCYFSRSGRPFIRFFKYEDEEGQIHTVKDVEVMYAQDKRYAGVLAKECLCRIVVGGVRYEARLLFFAEECRWSMVLD